jgi:hypothetical protein
VAVLAVLFGRFAISLVPSGFCVVIIICRCCVPLLLLYLAEFSVHVVSVCSLVIWFLCSPWCGGCFCGARVQLVATNCTRAPQKQPPHHGCYIDIQPPPAPDNNRQPTKRFSDTSSTAGHTTQLSLYFTFYVLLASCLSFLQSTRWIPIFNCKPTRDLVEVFLSIMSIPAML